MCFSVLFAFSSFSIQYLMIEFKIQLSALKMHQIYKMTNWNSIWTWHFDVLSCVDTSISIVPKCCWSSEKKFNKILDYDILINAFDMMQQNVQINMRSDTFPHIFNLIFRWEPSEFYKITIVVKSFMWSSPRVSFSSHRRWLLWLLCLWRSILRSL